jgi:hypothetical protein
MQTAEHERLTEARTEGVAWMKWGPLPQRKAMGNRPRGLQRLG